jgi:glutamine cyclotransferase
MKTDRVLTMLAAVLCLATSTLATAADKAVARVVVVETTDAAAYLQALEQGRAILKSIGSTGTVRVYRARFAGPETGTIVVAVEYPSLAAFAADEPRISGSAEYQAWLKSLDKVRKIVSDSLYQEL